MTDVTNAYNSTYIVLSSFSFYFYFAIIAKMPYLSRVYTVCRSSSVSYTSKGSQMDLFKVLDKYSKELKCPYS